ncbi:MAG TPA: DUF4432 family protein [Tepidisphaeraceae bacterium]|jgi:hypothetical protein
MDTTRFINPHQIGGIESYNFANGPARNTRALWVNTGGGLRYRILPDRGLDIDQAFFNQHSLTFLAHKGVTPPEANALRHGLDWLRGFGVGLLTSCGPTNIGGPATDNGEEVGLHGPHSGTPATLESIVQPDPRNGRMDMSVTAMVRYGAFYGPCIELRRTITSTLGQNTIDVRDEFFNAGNEDQPHGWLLHINMGYPLCDQGAQFCYDASRIEPLDDPATKKWFGAKNAAYKKMPAPLHQHHGPNSFVAYVYPKPSSKNGDTTVGVVNKKLGLGVAIHYNTREFARCGNWQHWGRHEYVAALEPMTGGVEGRDKDRARGWLQTLPAGGRKSYHYQIEVVTDRAALNDLLALNRP